MSPSRRCGSSAVPGRHKFLGEEGKEEDGAGACLSEEEDSEEEVQVKEVEVGVSLPEGEAEVEEEAEEEEEEVVPWGGAWGMGRL